MRRRDLLRRGDPEPLREHRRDAPHLHVAETGQRREPPLQVGAVARLGPEPRCVAAVLLGDVRGEILHALAIAPGNR